MSVASKRLERLEALAEQQRAQRIATQERQWNAALAAISREDRQVLIEWYDLLEVNEPACHRASEATQALAQAQALFDDPNDEIYNQWIRQVSELSEDGTIPTPPAGSLERLRRAIEDWKRLRAGAEKVDGEVAIAIEAHCVHLTLLSRLIQTCGVGFESLSEIRLS